MHVFRHELLFFSPVVIFGWAPHSFDSAAHVTVYVFAVTTNKARRNTRTKQSHKAQSPTFISNPQNTIPRTINHESAQFFNSTRHTQTVFYTSSVYRWWIYIHICFLHIPYTIYLYICILYVIIITVHRWRCYSIHSTNRQDPCLSHRNKQMMLDIAHSAINLK